MSTPPIPMASWPGPTDTGVPPGAVLIPAGPLELRTDGQVVTDLDITGPVHVYAKGVVLRRSRITCTGPGPAIRTFDTTTGLLLEDLEIDGGGRAGAAAGYGGYTMRRVDIHNVIDGPRLGTGTVVLDSWIHDLIRQDRSHSDCLQTAGTGEIVVRHNRLDAYQTGNTSRSNSCLTVRSADGYPVSSLLFEDNYCNGGNYTIGVDPDVVAVDVVFRRNSFGRDCRYGVVAQPGHPGVAWDESNVWFDNGQPVVS